FMMKTTDEVVEAICDAIFTVESTQVVETYSEYDQKPISFSNALELAKYISECLAKPNGLVDLSIVYPEMGSRPILKKIELDPKRVKEYKFRYTWGGWGLISVQISLSDQKLCARVSANSESRATKWASTYPEFGPVSNWNWAAVKRHKDRLSRVLKKYA
ncbi:hypothetical protein DZF83_25635, partial [Vibrio parahaemolyticus]|nr:hypothetical protein [Vibrio parahaemolyticus]